MQKKLFIILLISFTTVFSSSCDFPLKAQLTEIANKYQLDFLKPILGSEEKHEDGHIDHEDKKHADEHHLSSHHEIQDHEKHSHNQHLNIKSSKHQIDYGILWVQNSAEYSALCHQAYNIAKLRLSEKLKE